MWPLDVPLRAAGELPGDGLDKADADDESESEREKDCPSIGGEAEAFGCHEKLL
jgi:hypothetical protein